MLKSSVLYLLMTLVSVGTALAQSAVAATPCSKAALNALNVPAMTIAAATEVAAAPGIPAYCRVIGEVRTDGDGAGVNRAGFQIDLPTHWNSKFLFLGGGGMDGDAVLKDATPQQLTKGFATASSNSGHPDANGTFAITAPGVPNEPALIDYFSARTIRSGSRRRSSSWRSTRPPKSRTHISWDVLVAAGRA